MIKSNLKFLLLVYILLIANKIFYSQDSIVVINELLVRDKNSDEFIPYSTTIEKFKDKKYTPLGVRYFNFGCVKTPKNKWWKGQIDYDMYGHAIFNEAKWGILAFIEVTLKQIEENKRNTPFKFISVYAPPEECIGDKKNPDGSCKYGKNPTEKYAQKIADALGLSMDEIIILRNDEGELQAEVIAILFSAIAKFELGLDCKISVEGIKDAFKEYEIEG